MMLFRLTVPAIIALLLVGIMSGCGQQPKDITFTTSSAEARDAFMNGLSKFDMLEFNGASESFAQAVEADSEFAMAYYYWALSSATTSDFEERLNKAVEFADKVSEPESLVIMSLKASNDGNDSLARKRLEQVVALLPEGKRAHATLGDFYYGQQEWVLAEKEYVKVTQIDTTFAPVYNQLGYLFSNLGRYDEAIAALKKYSALRPEDANPHDSMGEIYLWMGDYENSMNEYRMSLELDPDFTISIAGIGHNYVLQNEFDKARAEYAEMLDHAGSVGDTITSSFWIALSYLYETNFDKAVEVMKDRLKFAESHHNSFQMAAINGQLGSIFEEMGDYDKALEYCARMRKIAAQSDIGEGNREFFIRNASSTETLVFARRGNMEMANLKIDEYEKSADASGNKIAIMNIHGLKGMAAYWDEDYQMAAEELKLADPQDQYYKYYLGLALEEEGETEEAGIAFDEIARFNHNGLEYSYVRPAAMLRI